MLWAPILSTIFRIIFMIVYNPYPTWKGRWKSVLGVHCVMAFGGAWIFDAYVFLIPLVLVTLPAHYALMGITK